MNLKKFRPTSAGIRGRITVSRSELYKGRPVRNLTRSLKNAGGRNSHGRLTSRRKGGRVKRLFRTINLNYKNLGFYKILRREYDPNRTAWIDLVQNELGQKSYILAGDKVKVNDHIEEGLRLPGSRIQLKNLKEGDEGFALSVDKFGKAKIGRAAGTAVKLMNFSENNKANVKLPSGELKQFSLDAWITFGRCSNSEHKNEKLGKAGVARRRGRRPIVRGLAQGAYDHPMGGKCGKTKGKIPKTRWGKPAKFVKTRNPRKNSSKSIIKRRVKN